MKKILIFLFFFSFNLYAQVFTLGRFSVGESRIPLDLNEFLIHTKKKSIQTHFIKESVQWIRNENNLLTPRVLLEINATDKEDGSLYILQNKKIIIPTEKNDIHKTQIYVDLFNPGEIEIYSKNQLIDSIIIEAKSHTSAKSKQLIDYSCSPYSLKIEGIDNEYLSVGCKMFNQGPWYKQTPRLEITMSSTNLKTMSGNPPPYFIYMEDNSPAEINLMDHDKKINQLHLEANIPSRIYRLHTSFGLGPYIYKAKTLNAATDSLSASSFMIYGKFSLTETASIKAFDALLYSKSLFNNSGLYLSYDLADIFDGRILINALLGFQAIHFSYARKTMGTEFKTLYPQGFEVLYKHAFGFENYHLFYGMFLSTNQDPYTNAWLRYGKNIFLELNYIDWGHNSSHIQMWGLSLGFPFINGF